MGLLVHVIHRTMGCCLWEVSDTSFGEKSIVGVGIDGKLVKKQIYTSFCLVIPPDLRTGKSLLGGAPCVLWRKCQLHPMDSC